MGRVNTIDTSVIFNAEAKKLTEQLPALLQRKWAIKATKQAAQVVAKEARRLAPRSSEKTGTRKKWSKKTASERSRFKPLHRSIKAYSYTKRNQREIVARVWAPAAAWIEFGHKKQDHVWWGKKSGTKLRPRPFLRPAADRTVHAQQQAVIKTLKKGLEVEAKKAK